MPRGFKKAFLARVAAAGGWTPLLDRYAEGESLGKIAPDYGVSRMFLYTYLKSKSRPKLQELFLEARAARAEHLADEAQEIADNVPATRDDVSKAKLRIEQRRWRASLLDKEMFGESLKQQPAAQTVINIGELFVKALRERPTSPPKQLPSGNEHPVLDAVVEPETPTTDAQ